MDLKSLHLKRGRLLHSYCQVGRSVKLLRGGRENGYIVVKVQTWYKSCQHLPNWHNWQAKDANMLGHVQIDAVIPDRHSSCPPCNKMTQKELLEKNLVLPIQPFCSLPAQLDDPNFWKQVTGSSTLQQAGPSRLSFANFVLLDCSLCNLPALQLIRIVCNRLTNVIWHTIALLFYVCGNILQKKMCDHCNPLNQHVDQSLATRCVFSPLSIRAALGEVPCCYCRYLILQHYSMGCRPFWYSLRLNR